MAEINLGNDETINATLSNVDTIQANVSTEENINANVYDVNYIPGYVVAEQERRANEAVRQANEADRIALYEDMEYKLETGYFKGDKGDKGDPGTTDHALLINKDLANQHPISSITGLQEALNNIVIQAGVYRGTAEPESPYVLIWIDTSVPPITGTQLITADDLGFYTKDNEAFILKEPSELITLVTSDNKDFITSDNKAFVLSEIIENALLTSDNKEFIEANNKKFILREEN